MKLRSSFVALSVLTVLGFGCSRTSKNSAAEAKRPKSDAEQLQKQLKDVKPSNETPFQKDQVLAVNEGEVLLPKEIFGKQLLWASSLQSMITTDPSDTSSAKQTQRSFIIGNKVASFQRQNGKVLLVADESVSQESDLSLPLVLGEFDLVSETVDGFLVKGSSLGLQSLSLLGGNFVGKIFLRSASFEGGVLNLELSAQDAVGNLFNFLEGVLPRPQAQGLEILGAGPSEKEGRKTLQSLLATIGTFPATSWFPSATGPQENPSTGFSGVAKEAKSFVSRYDISEGKTIDWWVTSNTPETLMPEMKAGVEGWNRYFNDFRPANPVMRFRGRLPETVKIGDPRYNVVVFDAVADSPSAYESQSVDPLSGTQTHSLIYMPFAWYNISSNVYLKGGDEISAESALAAGSLKSKKPSATKDTFGSNAKSFANSVKRCDRPVDYKELSFMVKSRVAENIDEAGRALMRSTLLHEVGHALGMDHNFKGTLSGDIRKYNETDWVYSTSTMDYNPFAMEDTLFADLGNPNRDVTKGLVQPYDRQFIDVVYNQGQGTLAREEKPFPFCNDEDHENKVNGVDPLCRQYDFFAAPTQTLRVPLAKLSSEENALPQVQGSFVTLKGFLLNEQKTFAKGLQEALKGAETQERLDKMLEALADFEGVSVAGFRHYVASGTYSVTRALTRDIRLLGEWKPVDGVTQDTTLAYSTGLQWAQQFIKNLFASSGAIDGEAFKFYERKVQSDITEQMVGILKASTGLKGVQLTESDASSVIGSAPKPSKSVSSPSLNVQQHLEAAALFVTTAVQAAYAEARNLTKSPEEAKALEDALAAALPTLNSQMESVLLGSASRLIGGLDGIEVTVTEGGSWPVSRPFIAPKWSHRIFEGLVTMAASTKIPSTVRVGLIGRLVAIDTQVVRFDPQMKIEVGTGEAVLASEVRTKSKTSLVEGLKLEVAPLKEKSRKMLYLSEQERLDLENLSLMLADLGG